MMSLTQYQSDCLRILHAMIRERGWRWFTLEAYAAALGMRNKSQAFKMLRSLEERGWIARQYVLPSGFKPRIPRNGNRGLRQRIVFLKEPDPVERRAFREAMVSALSAPIPCDVRNGSNFTINRTKLKTSLPAPRDAALAGTKRSHRSRSGESINSNGAVT